MRPAISQQWNFAVEYQLPKGNVLTATYVGQHNTHLMVPEPYLQKMIVNGAVVPGPYLSGNPALLAEVTQVSGTASDGNQKYNALQTHVRKRFAFGFEYQFGFTYSKGMTDAQGYYGSPGQAAGNGDYTQNIYNRKAEWGPTFFDNKYNATGSFVYGLPFGHKQRFGAHWIPSCRYAAGRLAIGRNLYCPHRFPVDHQSVRRPLRHRRARRAGQSSPTASRSPRNRTNEPYLDPTAYSVPGPHTFGTAGVGIVRGPGMSRVDLWLNKQFRATEHTYFQLRLAAFNATNTPIFQAPASLVITAPTFGQIRSSQSERNVQIVAKFYF